MKLYYELQALYFALMAQQLRPELLLKIADLEEYARKLNLGNGYFFDGNEQLKERVDEYLRMTSEYDKLIRDNSNYHIIQDSYERLYRVYTTRLKKISEGKACSLGSIYEELD